MNLGQMSPSLAARTLSMAAFMYYKCDYSAISDADNDALAKYVARNFDLLEPEMQERLESADAILATTHHILISRQTYEAAFQWAFDFAGPYPEFVVEAEQETPTGMVGLMGVG